MKTVHTAQRPTWWLLKLMILVMAGLRRPVEFVAVALTARIGLQLGIVIGGFWLVWYWLRRNSAAMASLNNRAPKETVMRGSRSAARSKSGREVHGASAWPGGRIR